jgi:hypothetical protein
MIIAGTAIPAISVIPTGAPTSVPNCQRIFFFLLHGFLPQNVQPEGLEGEIKHVNIGQNVQPEGLEGEIKHVNIG